MKNSTFFMFVFAVILIIISGTLCAQKKTYDDFNIKAGSRNNPKPITPNNLKTFCFCPVVSAGNDVMLDCLAPCAELNATCQELNETSAYTVSSIPYAPPYAYNMGTPITLGAIDDVWSDIIDLPFTFCFYGNSYDHILVGSNGVLTFNATENGGFCPWSFASQCPSGSLVSNAIFGVYQDLDLSIGGSLYYAELGSSPDRMFVISSNEIPLFSSVCNSMKATHQVVLYESSNIIEVYVQNKPLCSNWNSGNALIGIQDSSGAFGVTPPGRNTGAWTANYEAWRFTPAGNPAYTLTWWQDTVQIGTGNNITVCPDTTTTYIVQADYHLCFGNNILVSDTVTVFPYDSSTVVVSPMTSSICQGDSVTIIANCGTSYSWAPASGLDTTGGSEIIASPSTTTIYTLTAVSYNGSVVQTNVEVNVNQLNLDVQVSDYTLTADSSANAYQWLDCNNSMQPIAGEINQSYTATGPGSYAVVITQGGCSDTSSCNEVPALGIKPVQSAAISVYPNPVSDDLIIEYIGNIEAKDLVIVNSIGELVYSATMSKRTIVHTSGFPSGIYVIKLESDKSVMLQKFVKK
ncbi:MAG TPA: T9SS type A sorting domain-containing protein [Bacteroidales bacterium]|nr:T9SS type A sorting domain-containing protein [Bacteroidales bacterium]